MIINIMKCLILFSGTKSISKVFKSHNWECRGVDIDNKFKPFYNVDILTWNYKEIDYIPSYLHASPVCKFFSSMKNQHFKHDKEDGLILFRKTLEIIEYFKELNPNLKVTIENPVNKVSSNLDIMGNYKRIKTSYCKYGFKYMKKTYFWYSGFDLNLKECCKKSSRCDLSKETGRHRVVLGFTPKHDDQMIGWKWFKELRKLPEYKGIFTHESYFRYRIPSGLIEDIYNCI